MIQRWNQWIRQGVDYDFLLCLEYVLYLEYVQHKKVFKAQIE